MRRPLLVGQAPGPGTDPEEPLAGRCGARLARLAGMDEEEFLARFERVNLLPRHPGKEGKGDRFPVDRARRGAVALLVSGGFSGRPVVLLGGNVARAFGLAGLTPLTWYPKVWTTVAISPHPSGVSRWWNDPGNQVKAALFWLELGAMARGRAAA